VPVGNAATCLMRELKVKFILIFLREEIACFMVCYCSVNMWAIALDQNRRLRKLEISTAPTKSREPAYSKFAVVLEFVWHFLLQCRFVLNSNIEPSEFECNNIVSISNCFYKPIWRSRLCFRVEQSL